MPTIWILNAFRNDLKRRAEVKVTPGGWPMHILIYTFHKDDRNKYHCIWSPYTYENKTF